MKLGMSEDLLARPIPGPSRVQDPQGIHRETAQTGDTGSMRKENLRRGPRHPGPPGALEPSAGAPERPLLVVRHG